MLVRPPGALVRVSIVFVNSVVSLNETKQTWVATCCVDFLIESA